VKVLGVIKHWLWNCGCKRD